ncbi:MAG: site-2 protease family protein [Rubinisphaera brasiliensis]|uniref:site-2 protease family protein n=1 Tax=Rubinisphaera brasiliensis TaxID=119 RepID=UPI000C57F7B3|nr:hypothetical protein [Planctomyces sp.]MBR9803597.1 site-2 protease family protein [bacterium]
MSDSQQPPSSASSSGPTRQVHEVLIYPDGRAVPVEAKREPQRPVPIWRQTQFLWSIGLFIATCLSTWYVGQSRYGNGYAYMIPVMSILLAHEMGHYITSLLYRVTASPPFFLPMPGTPLGTLGAVIVKRAGGREDRKILFDIAIAGPLAGLVVAIPVCIYGAITAVPVDPADLPDDGFQFIAPPIVAWIVELVRGDWPAGRVLDGAVLDAGWVGIFITALNLIPIGQLDGGHMLYALIGKRAHKVATGLIVGSLAYMLLTGNVSLILMLFLIMLMGPYHPPTANDKVPLGWFRVVLGWVTLSFILIGFTPTPIVPVSWMR